MSKPPSAPSVRVLRKQLSAAAQGAATTASAAIAASRVALPAAAGPSGGAPDAISILTQLWQKQQLQTDAAQAQQALYIANAELARLDSLAQQRQSGAGPTPTFHGTKSSDELAVNTWLEAMESWFTRAHVDVDADAERIEIAAASFRDSAQQWWSATRATDAVVVSGGGLSTITQWTDVTSLLRKQYLPQDPAR